MIVNMLAANGWESPYWIVYWVIMAICLVAIFAAAVLSILLVLFQKSNSEGIQGITASSETFFGKNKGRSIESKLKKWTWILLGVIGVLSVVIYVMQLIAPSA